MMGTDKDIKKEVLNTPIQGGAASVVNRAMIRIYKRLLPMKSRLLLQIHDELLVEVWRPELAKVKKLVKEEMERPMNWRGEMVSFPVDQKTEIPHFVEMLKKTRLKISDEDIAYLREGLIKADPRPRRDG